MGTNILKLHSIYIWEQLSFGLIAVWRLQNVTHYFPLLGFAEEMLKSSALLDFSEHERSTEPRKIWTLKIPRSEFEVLGWEIILSVCRAVFSDLCCISSVAVPPLPHSPATLLLSLVLIPFFHLKLGCPCLGQNFCVDWCKQPDIGLPKPDLILFLQLSPEEAAARGDFGSERYENSLFQEKVLKSFYHLMKDKTLNWKVSK